MLEVYASLWNELAFKEREHFKINHLDTGMAVLINESFKNEYANGVIISIPENDKIKLLIDVQYGESSVTNPVDNNISESILYSDITKDRYRYDKRSSISDIFYSNDNNEQLLTELRQISKFLYELLAKDSNFGIDLEFKLMDEEGSIKIYIKQARLLNNRM